MSDKTQPQSPNPNPLKGPFTEEERQQIKQMAAYFLLFLIAIVIMVIAVMVIPDVIEPL